jgi:hypothetical protein
LAALPLFKWLKPGEMTVTQLSDMKFYVNPKSEYQITGVDYAIGEDETVGTVLHPDGTIEFIHDMDDLERIFGKIDGRKS